MKKIISIVVILVGLIITTLINFFDGVGGPGYSDYSPFPTHYHNCGSTLSDKLNIFCGTSLVWWGIVLSVVFWFLVFSTAYFIGKKKKSFN